MKREIIPLKIFVIILMFFGANNTYPQMKRIALDNVKSEANFYTKDDILYSDGLVVKFNQRVIPLEKGIRFTDKTKINPNFAKLRGIISQLEDKYGKIKIEKEIPNAVWGDVQRRNKITGEIVQIHDFSQLFMLRFSSPAPVDSLEDIFSRLSIVEFVHQPISITYNDEPNDPSYQSGIQWNLEVIDAEEAWNITHGSNSVKIGIVDEGIKENHDDLQGKIVGGTGYFHTDEPHGTWVAGVLGANTNNGEGIASLGWSLKLYNYGGPNTVSTNALVAQRIVDATDDGMDIINMSFGTLKLITLEEYFDYAPNCDGDTRQKWIDRIELGQVVIPKDYPEISDAVADAISAGIICIASAGNSSPNNSLLLPSPELCDPVQIPFHNYPSEYSGVIAVSGTWLYAGNEAFYPGWNYGNFIDVSAPGADIYTTDPNGSYSYRSGTSFSSPLTAALAGLIKSINPSFTYQQVTSILENTADKITAPTGHPYNGNGYSDALGYGRINAHKALLEALYQTALSNKSTIGSATGPNNQHVLERGHHGHLHEVFASGSEIFYRRSSNNGSSWSITKRLSSGNGNNNSVSIAAGSDPIYDNLRAVWQRKIDNTHYEIWYSYSLNSGSSWSTPSIVNGCGNVTISSYQSTANYAGGPTPVVASYWGAGEDDASFLLVYAASNGLHFRYAEELNNGWSIPGNDIVPGATSQYVWYPSLATYNSQDSKVYLIYGERYSFPSGHIYYQYFNEDVTWNSRIQGDNFNTFNRFASIAVDNSGLPIMAWCGQNYSGRYTITYKQGSGAYGKEWVESNNAFSPSLTYYNKGGSYPYGVDVLYHTTNKYVFSQVYSGSRTSDWTKNTLAYGDGYFPNVTHETSSSGIPKQIWTDLSSSPYSLIYNSNYLPKQNLNADKEFHRAVVVTDSLTGSQLRIEITQPLIKTTNGKEINISFSTVDSKFYSDLVKSNPFDFLKTEADNLPSDAESISFSVYINSSKPDTLEGGRINSDKSTPFKNISFESKLKNNSDKSLLSSFGRIAFVMLKEIMGILKLLHWT